MSGLFQYLFIFFTNLFNLECKLSRKEKFQLKLRILDLRKSWRKGEYSTAQSGLFDHLKQARVALYTVGEQLRSEAHIACPYALYVIYAYN